MGYLQLILCYCIINGGIIVFDVCIFFWYCVYVIYNVYIGIYFVFGFVDEVYNDFGSGVLVMELVFDFFLLVFIFSL